LSPSFEAIEHLCCSQARQYNTIPNFKWANTDLGAWDIKSVFRTSCYALGSLLKEHFVTAKNSGKPWTEAQVQQLKTLAAGNTPTRVIGLKMGRSESAVQSKAVSESLSLKPTNQSPYNRKKP
jgi:hypothetical protein